jgi:hypothetical protein
MRHLQAAADLKYRWLAIQRKNFRAQIAKDFIGSTWKVPQQQVRHNIRPTMLQPCNRAVEVKHHMADL